MRDKKEEGGQEEYCSQGLLLHNNNNNNNNNNSSSSSSNIQSFRQDRQILVEQQRQEEENNMHQPGGIDAYMVGGNSSSSSRSGLVIPSEVSPILPWTTFHQVPFPAQFVPVRDQHVDHAHPFLLPPPAPPTPYGGLFSRRPPGLQFGAYEGGPSDHLRFISETLGQAVHAGAGSSAPFGLQAELQKMTAQEIMDAKALAASKSHSEAERRRRERISNHLAKLRTLLPSTTKTDKASLLAEVIQHVKELKRQTSIIAETNAVPTETDELTVDNIASDEDGKIVIKASLCCEDRSDLLPDLIKTLKALKLRTLKAEITTLGGRMKNVLFITSEEDQHQDHDDEDDSNGNINRDEQQRQQHYIINSIQEALKAVMEKSSGDDSASGSVKRQRTNNLNILGT